MDEIDEEALLLEGQLGDYLGDLEISEDKLSEQISTQASKFVYYARVAAVLKRRMLHKDLDLKRYEAMTEKTLRRDASSRSEKLTNQSIEAEIRSTLQWKRLNEEMIDLKCTTDLAESIKEGFFQRKSMLEQTARSSRKEVDWDNYLREKIEQYKGRKAVPEGIDSKKGPDRR